MIFLILFLYFFIFFFFFFFNAPSTTEIYTLSLHDALPILDDFFKGLLSEEKAKAFEEMIVSDPAFARSEEHTSELQSPMYLVCRLLLEKKKKKNKEMMTQSTAEVKPLTTTNILDKETGRIV